MLITFPLLFLSYLQKASLHGSTADSITQPPTIFKNENRILNFSYSENPCTQF